MYAFFHIGVACVQLLGSTVYMVAGFFTWYVQSTSQSLLEEPHMHTNVELHTVLLDHT